MEYILGTQDCFDIQKSITVTCYISKKRLKKRENMLVSLDNIAKAFDKNPTSILVNTLCKLGIEGNFINMIRGIYTKDVNL